MALSCSVSVRDGLKRVKRYVPFLGTNQASSNSYLNRLYTYQTPNPSTICDSSALIISPYAVGKRIAAGASTNVCY